MRKLSALILVFVLLASALCGCSKSPEEQAKEALQDAQKSEQSKLDEKVEKLESKADKKAYLSETYSQELSDLYDSYLKAETYDDVISCAKKYNDKLQEAFDEAEKIGYKYAIGTEGNENLAYVDYMERALYMKYNSDGHYRYYCPCEKTTSNGVSIDNPEDKDVIMVFYNKDSHNVYTDMLFAKTDGSADKLDFTAFYKGDTYCEITAISLDRVEINADYLRLFDISGETAKLIATSKDEDYFTNDSYRITTDYRFNRFDEAEGKEGFDKRAEEENKYRKFLKV